MNLNELAREANNVTCFCGKCFACEREKRIESALRMTAERAVKVAENAFMDGVLPKHTTVRDFIAGEIRKELLEAEDGK